MTMLYMLVNKPGTRSIEVIGGSRRGDRWVGRCISKPERMGIITHLADSSSQNHITSATSPVVSSGRRRRKAREKKNNGRRVEGEGEEENKKEVIKKKKNRIRYDMIKACDAGNFSADGQPIQVRK